MFPTTCSLLQNSIYPSFPLASSEQFLSTTWNDVSQATVLILPPINLTKTLTLYVFSTHNKMVIESERQTLIWGSTKYGMLGTLRGRCPEISTSHITSFFLTFVPNLHKWPTKTSHLRIWVSANCEHLWACFTPNRASDEPPQAPVLPALMWGWQKTLLWAADSLAGKSIGQEQQVGSAMPEASGSFQT